MSDTATSPVGQDVLSTPDQQQQQQLLGQLQNPDPSHPPAGWTWTAQGWHLSYAALEQLFLAVGGPAPWAATMALVAEAESSGNAWEVNSSGFTGLWQQGTSDNGFPGRPSRQAMLDPWQNAVQAKALLGDGSGISNWGAGTGDAVGTLAQHQGAPLSWTQIQSLAQGMGVDLSGGVDSTNAQLLRSSIPWWLINPIITDPGGAAKAAGSVIGWADSLGKVLSWLTNPKHWIRIGEGALGIALIVGGVVIFIAASAPGQQAIGEAEQAAKLAAVA